jgi:hypothetical protein
VRSFSLLNTGHNYTQENRRFLRARRYDPVKAQQQFSDTQAWRKQHDVDNLFATFDEAELESAKRFYPRWTGRRDKVCTVHIAVIGNLPGLVTPAWSSVVCLPSIIPRWTIGERAQRGAPISSLPAHVRVTISTLYSNATHHHTSYAHLQNRALRAHVRVRHAPLHAPPSFSGDCPRFVRDDDHRSRRRLAYFLMESPWSPPGSLCTRYKQLP